MAATLSTDVCDPLDNDPSSMHFHTCTTARTDGHGRLIDQILRNRQDSVSPVEYHRLWTYYRNDGAVLRLVRAQTRSDSHPRPTTPGAAEDLAPPTTGPDPIVTRVFFYDSVGRRIGSDDPDTDNRNPGVPEGARSWRYLFNRAGDLVAVRDPRGCGQNFFYDLGGRLLGEQYVGCSEAQTSAAEQPIEQLPEAIGLGPSTTPHPYVDVRYFYDEYPCWIGSGGCGEHDTLDVPLPGGAPLLGRATGVADRAQRAAVSYDARGNAVWTARQVALLPTQLTLHRTDGVGAPFPSLGEDAATAGTVAYDWSHTYIRTALFDHAGRPTDMALPRDPDWNPSDAMDVAPLVQGHLAYDDRGLPESADLIVGSHTVNVVSAIHYLRDGLVDYIAYGDATAPPVVESSTQYDERRRPTRMTALRPRTGSSGLRAITAIADQQLVWDAASNLTFIRDLRDPNEWPVGHRPQSVEIQHDSLYRVVSALFDYSAPGAGTGSTSLGTDDSTDWRASAGHPVADGEPANTPNSVDPMRPDPAPMITTAPPERVQSLVWSWNWLGNMTEWSDDAQQFYERSIGEITNGHDVSERPSALYLAANLDPEHVEQSGWVELDYGAGGNVTAVTVHGRCAPTGAGGDIGTGTVAARRAAIRTAYDCSTEQHFEYRWDELNRISEAMRFDREGGAASQSGWTIEARQRYRYDGANVRVIKESFDTSTGIDASDTRVALYVYPGDFERRGLVVDGLAYSAVIDEVASTETQYLVAGARMVWDHDTAAVGTTDLDRNRRVTIPVGDLLHTTAASVDLLSGELLEVSTYYPNGARETLLVDGGNEGTEALPAVPLEPMGFTGKEADEDVGLVYFGERYLIARLGRWASPDPSAVHAAAGGEALNSYHYINGNLLQLTDPLGLAPSASALMHRAANWLALMAGNAGGAGGADAIAAGLRTRFAIPSGGYVNHRGGRVDMVRRGSDGEDRLVPLQILDQLATARGSRFVSTQIARYETVVGDDALDTSLLLAFAVHESGAGVLRSRTGTVSTYYGTGADSLGHLADPSQRGRFRLPSDFGGVSGVHGAPNDAAQPRDIPIGDISADDELLGFAVLLDRGARTASAVLSQQGVDFSGLSVDARRIWTQLGMTPRTLGQVAHELTDEQGHVDAEGVVSDERVAHFDSVMVARVKAADAAFLDETAEPERD